MRSRGLHEINEIANGKELFPNGDFSNGTIFPFVKDASSDASTTVTIDNGRLKVDAATSYDGAYYLLTGLTVGATYEISVDIELGTATKADVRIQGGFDVNDFTESGTRTIVATATTASFILRTSTSTGTVYFNNISVKEIPKVQGENLPDYVATRSNYGFKNYIINGGFDVWQRGTSATNNGKTSFLADRFQLMTLGGGTNDGTYIESRETATTSDNIPCSNYYRFNQTVAGDRTDLRILKQSIEVDPRIFHNKKFVYSFYVRSSIAIEYGLNFRVNFGTGGSPSANYQPTYPVSITADEVNQWVRKEIVIDLDLSSFTFGTDNNGYVFPHFNGIVELNNNVSTFDVTGIQLEEGSVATPFEQRPYGLELSLCQRYYEVSSNELGPSYSSQTAQDYFWSNYEFKVEKRIAPTMTFSNIEYQTSRDGSVTALANTLYNFGGDTKGGRARIDAITDGVQAYGVKYYWIADAEL
jgi:hypothetical protein